MHLQKKEERMNQYEMHRTKCFSGLSEFASLTGIKKQAVNCGPKVKTGLEP